MPGEPVTMLAGSDFSELTILNLQIVKVVFLTVYSTLVMIVVFVLLFLRFSQVYLDGTKVSGLASMRTVTETNVDGAAARKGHALIG